MNPCNKSGSECPYVNWAVVLHDSVHKLTENLIASTQEIAGLSATLRDLSDTVKELRRTVFGNGDTENALVAQIANIRSEQVGLVEKFNWIVAGVSAVVGSVLGVFVYKVFQ